MTLILSALLLTLVPAQQTDQAFTVDGTLGPSSQYGVCMMSGDAARGTIAGQTKCMRDEIDRQRERLNRSYRVLLTRLGPARRQKLKIAEGRWEKSHDKVCQREIHSEEGEASSLLIYNGCILDAVTARADFMMRYQRAVRAAK